MPCFMKLIQNNDLKALKKFMKLKHGKNMTKVQEGLHQAIEDGNCPALRIMLTSPLTTFHVEIASNKTSKYIAGGDGSDLAKFFLHTAIHFSNNEVLQILLDDNRFDVNQKANKGGTYYSPLMLACTQGKLEMIKSLLDHPETQIFPEDMIIAIGSSNIEIFNILLADKRCDVNLICNTAINGNTKSKEKTALMYACENEEFEMVINLLDHPEMDVNIIKEQKRYIKWVPQEYCSALDYTSTNRNLPIAQLLLNHRSLKQSHLQYMLLQRVQCQYVSIDCVYYSVMFKDPIIKAPKAIDFCEEFKLELIKILIKKNFENGFCLKNILDMELDELGWMGMRIASEIEMKIREEYYKGNVDVSEGSVVNKAFGISIDIWQALILKCKCVQCLCIKKLVFLKLTQKFECGIYDSISQITTSIKKSTSRIVEQDNQDKNKTNKTNETIKKTVECDVKAKLSNMYKNEINIFQFWHNREKSPSMSNLVLIYIQFTTLLISSPMPEIYELILLYGGFEECLDGIINGTLSITELHKDHKKDGTEVEDFSKLCWACSVTEVKLYKCGGCRKARYCSDKCIREDRKEHMDYCDKVKQKRKQKKSPLEQK